MSLDRGRQEVWDDERSLRTAAPIGRLGIMHAGSMGYASRPQYLLQSRLVCARARRECGLRVLSLTEPGRFGIIVAVAVTAVQLLATRSIRL
jgi:hypothetical protein